MIRQAGRKCQRCGRSGRLEVHHKVKVSKGGAKYDPANLEVICRACHFDEHRDDKRHESDIAGAQEWREFAGVNDAR